MLEVKFYVLYGKISNYMSNIGKQLISIPENTEIKISGNNSKKFLNEILSNNILKVSNEKAIYTLLCNPMGGVIDDLILFS